MATLNSTKGKTEKILITALMIVGGIVVSIPFIWMITSAFKPESEALRIPPTLLPEHPTLENFRHLFTELNFLVYLRNTLIIVFFSFIGLLFNGMAGYGFAKFEFNGREKIFYLVLATMMIPGQVTMIPVYLLLNGIGLTNTLPGIILPGLVAAFSIFLFRQFMTTIPTDRKSVV